MKTRIELRLQWLMLEKNVQSKNIFSSKSGTIGRKSGPFNVDGVRNLC